MPKRLSARGSPLRPSAYEELESNSYLGRSRIRLSPDEVPICQCKPFGEGGDSCGDDCQNRHTNHECHPAYCPCGYQCQNQQIQRHQFVETRCVGVCTSLNSTGQCGHQCGHLRHIRIVMQCSACGEQRLGACSSTEHSCRLLCD